MSQSEYKSTETLHNSINLLLIEDDPLARIATFNTFASTACHVTVAHNLAMALDLLMHIKFDLVVSDLGLPDGNGIDIVRTVKHDPNSLNYETPFLALTAHSANQKRIEAEHAGFLMVFTKPLMKEQAASIIDAYLPEPRPRATSKIANQPLLEGELPIIDFALSLQIVDGNKKLASELLGLLCAELPQDLLQIQEYKQKQDIMGLRELLHRLRGGLSYCAVPRLQQAAVALHGALRNSPSFENSEHFFQKFHEEASILLQEYEKL